jgi:plastocyanin
MPTWLGAALALAVPARIQPAAARSAVVRRVPCQPGSLEIGAGARVTWTNQDDILQTVTSGLPGTPDGRIDAPLSGRGASGSVVVTVTGVYPCFCARHPSMRGEIVVR